MKFLNNINVRCFFIVMMMLGKLVASELPIEQESLANEAASASLLSADFVVEPREQEYATLDTVFERVITLGDDCLTKKQINQYFLPEKQWTNTRRGHADLFDWMRIRDYNLFAEALSNKLTDFFERPDFIDGSDHYWKTLINTRYKMNWNHLFNKEYEGYWVTNQDGTLTSEAIDRVFPMLREKIDYLREKFIEAQSKKTLYVMHEKYSFQEKETLLRLRDSLTHIREGNREFAILCVTSRKRFESFENIFIQESIKIAPGWDGGDNERWKEILDEFHFTPDIWN